MGAAQAGDHLRRQQRLEREDAAPPLLPILAVAADERRQPRLESRPVAGADFVCGGFAHHCLAATGEFRREGIEAEGDQGSAEIENDRGNGHRGNERAARPVLAAAALIVVLRTLTRRVARSSTGRYRAST